MTITKVFNSLLELDTNELQQTIKKMTREERSQIVNLMELPRNCSQKRLCAEIQETALFIRAAKKAGH